VFPAIEILFDFCCKFILSEVEGHTCTFGIAIRLEV
jgi:hypothetical protein